MLLHRLRLYDSENGPWRLKHDEEPCLFQTFLLINYNKKLFALK